MIETNQNLTESNKKNQSLFDQLKAATEKLSLEIKDREQSENINSVLFAISNAVNITANLDDLYKEIHYLISKIIDVTNFFIAIVNERKQSLYFPYYVDTVDDDFSPITNFDTQDSLTGFVVSNRKPLLLKKKQLQELADKNGVWGPVPLIWMGVPLVVRDEIIAVMVVQSYTDPYLYNEKDLDVLVSISDQMAIAIDRKRTENELIQSESKYRSMMEAITDQLYICSPEFTIEYMNPAMIKRLGRDATGETCHKALYGLNHKCNWCIFHRIQKEEYVEYELDDPKSNKYYSIANALMVNSGGSISKLTIFRDVSNIKRMEKQLLQSQKMESIGTLAGGIAHDFNNILSPIIGYTELALHEVDKDSNVDYDLQEIHKAGMRAKDLVKQILTFARQTEDETGPIRLDIIVKEVLKFLKNSIPSTIRIKADINSESLINGSSGKIHQILMNLCTNASQAMEENGGILEVRLKDVIIDKNSRIPDPELSYGEYIEIKVSDTGTGIPSQNIQTIFEPYFTTKPVGEGTGMGLAVVLGIVESHGGKIMVDSTEGRGTTFIVYLPISKKRKNLTSYVKETLPGGKENLLFVDDEAPIAKMGSKVLEQLGYSVTTITSSIEALESFRLNPQAFDLVVTDMTMPDMTGDKLAVELMKVRSDIPVILCTGYSKKISEESAAEMGIKEFVYKPVVQADLAKTIRRILDEKNN